MTKIKRKIEESSNGSVNIKKYENFRHIVNMVIKGNAPACIIRSEGGLGKSFMVRKMLLDQSERSYIVKSGHITPLALYKLLYEHMDDIVVLDDAEGVLKSDTAVGILKC